MRSTHVPNPEYKPLSAQIGIELFGQLVQLRPLVLQQGVSDAVREVGIETVDAELHEFVPPASLTHLAALNIRGERVFPVPSIVAARPSLIGYYRMLLGISRKAFRQTYGYQRFERPEDTGTLTHDRLAEIPDLCRGFIVALAELVEAIYEFTSRDLEDLTLLTLGPTLQGQRNNSIGSQAGKAVFDAIKEIAGQHLEYETESHLRFSNPAGRNVEIDFANDPDVRISELAGAERVPLVAMEIKGGLDVSNAHNRVGEAEKSHLKARQTGFHHRWTLISVSGADLERFKDESPSTTDFFDFAQVEERAGADWQRFRDRLLLQMGLPSS